MMEPTAYRAQPIPPIRRESLFNCLANSDVLFVLNNQDRVWFPGHRSVLVDANPVFRVLLGTAADAAFDYWPSTTRTTIILEDNTNAFRTLLRFMYGKPVTFRSANKAMKALRIADKYLCADLATLCIEFLNNNIKVGTVLLIVSFIKPYTQPESLAPSAPPVETPSDVLMPSCNQLLENCLLFIDEYGEQVLVRKEITCLDVDSFRLIVLRNTLIVSSKYVILKAVSRWSHRECRRRNLRPTADNLKLVFCSGSSPSVEEDCIIDYIDDVSMESDDDYHSVDNLSQVSSEYHSSNDVTKISPENVLLNGPSEIPQDDISMNGPSEIPQDGISMNGPSEIPQDDISMNGPSETSPDHISMNDLSKLPLESTGAIPKSSKVILRAPELMVTPMEVVTMSPNIYPTVRSIGTQVAMQLSDGEESDTANESADLHTMEVVDNPNLMAFCYKERKIQNTDKQVKSLTEEIKQLNTEEIKQLNTEEIKELHTEASSPRGGPLVVEQVHLRSGNISRPNQKMSGAGEDEAQVRANVMSDKEISNAGEDEAQVRANVVSDKDISNAGEDEAQVRADVMSDKEKKEAKKQEKKNAKERKKAAKKQKREEEKSKRRAEIAEAERLKCEKREKKRQEKVARRKREAEWMKAREEEEYRMAASRSGEEETSVALKILECVCIGYAICCD